MNKALCVAVCAIVATNAYAALDMPSSNMPMGYHDFNEIEPVPPPYCTSETDLQLYSFQCERYAEAVNQYMKDADNDIKIIMQKKHEAAQKANEFLSRIKMEMDRCAREIVDRQSRY